ncbi:MAG TPA: YggS family pyridoxal phosphate-dependent enzyme [Acholeplasmataceae bacterium]|jgi:pyridoxal phosphate enzyme (YggS family)|nr:YggS family pyridoxal phosphate-dependent enzyme [Acholeplasmataceae bacterium]
MGIREQVEKVKKSLVDYPNVKIVAATKYVGIDETREVVEAGIKDIGENRAESLLEKYEALSDLDITWHFFGVLQTRKVRSIIDKIDYLHSLDSYSTANEINKRRKEPLKCFVQVNISEESTKSGLDPSKVVNFIKGLSKYDKIEVVGLMTIAKLTFDDVLLENYFIRMRRLQEQIQALNLPYAPCTELSMGMSNDYLLAVKYGATMVRLGRTIFNDN